VGGFSFAVLAAYGNGIINAASEIAKQMSKL